MHIPSTYAPYLSGASFSNGLHFALTREVGDWRYRSRARLIAEEFRGKSIVHVGFVDHDPASIMKKRKKGKWLHEQLVAVTTRCVGIDISEEAVRFVRDELHVPDVHCADITAPEVAGILAGTEWDCIFLGEVIEHVPNPIQFLKAMVQNFAACGVRYRSVMLSTPNGLYNERFQHMQQVERINSDHRYLFTPYTLSKVMTEAGLEVTSIRFCRNGMVKWHSVLKNLYYTLFPMLRPTLVAVGIPRHSTQGMS